MVPLDRLVSYFATPTKPRRSTKRTQSKGRIVANDVQSPNVNDALKTGILLFTMLFLALMAIASLIGSILAVPKSDKVAVGFLAVFGGTLKGLISVTKMLIS